MSDQTSLGDHPWWQHVPKRRRNAVLFGSYRRHLHQQLAQRKNLILTIAGFYLVACFLPILFGAKVISLLAFVPLIFFPTLLALIWWLTWKEFHH
ncbi:MAG: hypothetical protein VKI42_08995 [Synechococcaceae cyanobacterium]|nr:hypothetical protein [Synechococcaceae cyanobacterium]